MSFLMWHNWMLLSLWASQQLTGPDKNRGDKSMRCPSRTEWEYSSFWGFLSYLPNLHFYTSSQNDLGCYFFLLLLLFSAPPFSHFPSSLSDRMCFWHPFLPLPLRDGRSHLKLNTRPGATQIQPSVRPCPTSFFLFLFSPSVFVSIVSQEKVQQKKKKKSVK